MNVHGIEV